MWRTQVPGNAGVLTTGSGLVFQGNAKGRMVARAADTGAVLWDYDARVGIIGATDQLHAKRRAICHRDGRLRRSSGAQWSRPRLWRESSRLGLPPAKAAGAHVRAWEGKSNCPPAGPLGISIVAKSSEKADPRLAQQGQHLFDAWCARCHGAGAVANGTAPELRASSIPLNGEAFAAVVRQGVLVPRGMPRYDEFLDRRCGSDTQLRPGTG